MTLFGLGIFGVLGFWRWGWGGGGAFEDGGQDGGHVVKRLLSWQQFLTLKLAGHFAKHIQAREGGSLTPPKNFETAIYKHMPFSM